MILQVFADLRAGMHDFDAVFLQDFAAADARQFEDVRRPDGAGGQHDLAPRRDAFHPPAALIFNPADAPVLNEQAAHLCPHAQLKVGAREDGFQEGF